MEWSEHMTVAVVVVVQETPGPPVADTGIIVLSTTLTDTKNNQSEKKSVLPHGDRDQPFKLAPGSFDCAGPAP